MSGFWSRSISAEDRKKLLDPRSWTVEEQNEVLKQLLIIRAEDIYAEGVMKSVEERLLQESPKLLGSD